MPIRIQEGADPLSDASRLSDDDGIVINAQSEAGRVLRQELTRYCRGEINGRSFLIAGHRGAGKTTMVSDAIDGVLRRSRRAGSGLMQPLPVFLHGPSLFESEERGEAALPTLDGSRQGRMAEQAKAALTQIILGLHRAVVREFARAYRQRLTLGAAFAARPQAQRAAFAELAAQFELELVRDPSAARLREFWALAEALECGVLRDEPALPSGRVDRGALELVAVCSMCEAYQRISGELSSQMKTQEEEARRVEASAGISLKGAELVRPVVSVMSGVLVAATGQLLAGLATAVAASMFFTRSSTRTESESRSTDTTFIPDLSLKTLDRILPTLLQRLRDAGLAPVLVLDELDKVERLSDRLVAMIYYLKKLVAENVFTCFLTDRGYLEQLRLAGGGAYNPSFSYFSHPLLVNFRPADFDGYLGKLLRAEPGAQEAEGADRDKLDLEVIKWTLRHRSELHALSLTREVSLLRGNDGIVALDPGRVRTEAGYRIAVTFQVVLELQLAQPNVAAWLRLQPMRSQTLIDALYYPSRCWSRGGRSFAWAGRDEPGFVRYLVERMNLDEETRTRMLADIAGGSADEVLPQDDRKLLGGMLDDMLGLLTQHADEGRVRQRWADLPLAEWDKLAMPSLAVFQSMLVGQESLLIAGQAGGFEWRYRPSGALRDPQPAPPMAAGPEGTAAPAPAHPLAQAWDEVGQIRDIEAAIAAVFDLAAGEPVLELLAERLRILPTTPAWQPVRQAIGRLEALRDGPSNAAPWADDARAVHGFIEMLQANAEPVCAALTLAGFLAGTGESGADQEKQAVAEAARLLAEGLHFHRLDGIGLIAAVDAVRNKLAHAIDAEWPDGGADYTRLRAQVVESLAAGRAKRPHLHRQELADAAWEAARLRIEHWEERSELPPASWQELLAAVRRAGPSRILGLNYDEAPLTSWTTALMLAAEFTRSEIAPSNAVPRWVIRHALGRLGAGTLTAPALGPLAELMVASGRETRLLPPAGGEDRAASSDRIALCIVSPVQAEPMRAWRTRPELGLALVCTAEQAELLVEHELLQLGAKFVIARSGELGARSVPLPPALAGAFPEVWVYRRREPDMRQPAIVDPPGPDLILERAQPRRASSSASTAASRK